MRKIIAATLLLIAVGVQAQEPEYYEHYREQALLLVDNVTSSVDALKEFRESERFKDLATDLSVQSEYTSKILTLDNYLKLVRVNLLSTPTLVLRTATMERDSVKRMNQFRTEP